MRNYPFSIPIRIISFRYCTSRGIIIIIIIRGLSPQSSILNEWRLLDVFFPRGGRSVRAAGKCQTYDDIINKIHAMRATSSCKWRIKTFSNHTYVRNSIYSVFDRSWNGWIVVWITVVYDSVVICLYQRVNKCLSVTHWHSIVLTGGFDSHECVEDESQVFSNDIQQWRVVFSEFSTCQNMKVKQRNVVFYVIVWNLRDVCIKTTGIVWIWWKI